MMFLKPHQLVILCLFLLPSMAQSTGQCNAKQIEIVSNGTIVWNGSTLDLFKKYSHGQLGYGNRPQRPTLRIARLAKELEIDPEAELLIQACRNKSITMPIARLLQGETDFWLVPISTGEIRIFEFRKNASKPDKHFKRIMRIEFTKKQGNLRKLEN